MVEREARGVLLPDKIWRFVWLARSPVEPRFIQGLLQNEATRWSMSEMATGTSASMKNISQAKLKMLPIIVPPIERQRRFAELVATTRYLSWSSIVADTASGALAASAMSKTLDVG